MWLAIVVDAGVALAVGTLVVGLYLLTLSPTMVAGDAGELVTAAYELGVPHPPGYPLWCLLAHEFVVLLDTIPDVAYRVNLLSAVCGAGTCMCVYAVGRRLGLGQLASVASALLLGASRELWQQSVQAEVYSLNSLLFSGCLLCLVLWERQRKNHWLLLFSFVLGLGLANHHTVGIIGPVGVVWVLCRDWRKIRDYRFIGTAIILFIIPLSLYLYLPLRSATNPYMDWGHPVTLAETWEHITRAQYRVNYTPVPRTAASMYFQFTVVARYCLDQFSPAVGLSALVAVPFAIKRRRQLRWWFIGLLCVGTMVAYAWILNTKCERQEVEANKVFFIPVYCCAAVLIGCVLDDISVRVSRFFARRMPVVPAHFLCLLCLLVPAAAAAGHNLRANDFSDYWYAEDHARNMLATLEKGAVIFPFGDHNTFPLIYLHRVKGERPDIVIADKYGYVESRSFPEVRTPLKNKTKVPKGMVIHYLLSKTDRPVYFTVKSSLPKGLDVQQIQMGVLYRAGRKPPKDDPKTMWARYNYRNARNSFKDAQDYGAVNVVSDYYYFRGLSLLQSKETEQALGAFASSAKMARGIKEVYNNIGSALAENGLLAEAQRYYRLALRLDGRYVNALWNIARTSSAMGRRKDAAAHFERLHEVTPKDFRVPGELGFLYLRHLGFTKQAVECFEASLALKPNQPQIKQVMKELAAAGFDSDILRRLRAERLAHDFGKVLIKQKVRTEIGLTNVSRMPLDLVDVRSDCGCVTAKASTRKLGPGESTKLEVTFQETRKTGPQSKHVTLRTSAGQKLVIAIGAHVVPYFTADPPRIEVTEAIPRVRQSWRVEIRAHRDEPFGIAGVESTLTEVRPLQVETLRRERSRQVLAVEVNPGLKIGRRDGKLSIRVDDPDKSVVEVPVTLVVRSPVVITPRSVFLRSLPRRGVKTVSVTIDLYSHWSAKVTEVVASASWLKVPEPPERIEGKTAIKIEIDSERVPHPFSGTVIIRTDHESVPNIIIPVYGFSGR